MSGFSDVDNSAHAEALLRYLDDTDSFMSAFKAYVVATLGRYAPDGRVLDVGCGVGHDLVRLAAAGLAPVGVDTSQVALLRAKSAGGRVVRGDGGRLPFRCDAFDGCRIERVLQHVVDPGAVLDEILRVVKPAGVIAVLEPDHTSMRVDSTVDPTGTVPGRFVSARHPAIGAETARLLRTRGCVVDDIVTEHSFGYHLDQLPINAGAATARAVSGGDLSPHVRQRWLAEQEERMRNKSFRATWDKILVVARAPVD
jgi:SAM-dependent methyltransferase